MINIMELLQGNLHEDDNTPEDLVKAVEQCNKALQEAATDERFRVKPCPYYLLQHLAKSKRSVTLERTIRHTPGNIDHLFWLFCVTDGDVEHGQDADLYVLSHNVVFVRPSEKTVVQQESYICGAPEPLLRKLKTLKAANK